MRILIVEDEARSRESLAKGLRESGFLVDAARDGGEAIYLTNGCEYDLIVLDVMLPVLDGWQVLEKIREKNTHTPVLFLTARDAVFDRVGCGGWNWEQTTTSSSRLPGSSLLPEFEPSCAEPLYASPNVSQWVILSWISKE
jgi:CheY-like chemotaxis protein